MPPKADQQHDDPEYFQSVDAWMNTTEFSDLMKNEFPDDAAEWLDPVSRRQFLTVMGASVALAGAIGCNPSLKPASAKKVVPYVRQPDQMLPGVPLFFATAFAQQGGIASGLIVKQTEGRPIKAEGNPNHPSSLGGADAAALASILSLYDPDRAKQIKFNGTASGYDKFITSIKDELEKQKGKEGEGVRFLTEPSTSPTFAGLVGEFAKRFPKAKWLQYEPVNRDNSAKAHQAAFGKPVNAIVNFAKAKVVLALDSDFLTSGPSAVRSARDFMHNRKVRDGKAALKAGDGVALDAMNRLYSVESMLTNSGAVADHRLPLKPSQVLDFAKALAAKLGIVGVPAVTPKLPDLAEKWLVPLADDLNAHKGSAVVVVGDAQPAEVHLLALAINEKLGAFKSVLTFIEPVESKPADHFADLKNLTEDLKAGKVDLLFVLGGNPVYDAPVDLDFGKVLMSSKAVKVRFATHEDETAIDGQCQWFVNAAHYLETWGDVRGHDGTASIQQPLIAPLSGGRSFLELFSTLLDLGTSDPLDVVQAQWHKHFDEKVKTGDFTAWWEKCLRDGVIPGTAAAETTVATVKLDALNDASFQTPAIQADGLQLQFLPDPMLFDGRYANNGWLQETPKPITKLTWDNAAIVSPGTAARLGIVNAFGFTGGENGRTVADMVSLTVNGRTLDKVAVFILPGHADDAITLHLGHGRTRGGKVAVAQGYGTGFAAYKLRATMGLWIAGNVEVGKPTEKYFLACTQGQYAMESRRPVRHATVEEFRKDKEFAQVPAQSAAEYKELRALTPGTPEDFERLGLKHPHAKGHDSHGHDHAAGEEHHAGHDKRIIPLSLYPENPSKVNGKDASTAYRRWALVVDLGACTGCSVCVTACVSENNIPVVGKDTVTRGRAMHWIRVDRYFSMPNDEPMSDDMGSAKVQGAKRSEMVKKSDRIRTHFQPVLCQQCEKAPCEVVCPVGATVHSADGLNDMAYNRCVGTRYCSNNCPYKVRRFNFIQYADYATDSLKLVNNPEVSVRTRGVMEKCTYCVQRIRNAEMETEREFDKRKAAGKIDQFGRPKIMDGEIVTACQAACPANAISFGDLNDHDSAVLRAKAEDHNYGLLAELNVMPRTSYLAAIRNPNPAMPKGGA